MKKNPLVKLLPVLKTSFCHYGLAIEHAAFTPLSIRHVEILYNDRPFAAYILLKSFLISTDTIHHQRLSASISTGIVGPAAFGEGMQKTIHKWLKNIEPLGWENQIQNDPVLNLEFNYEKQVYNYKNILQLSTLTKVKAGTLMDNIEAGGTLMSGIFNSAFASPGNVNSHKLTLYVYAQPSVSFVGYDATLQGGFFNRSSPYTISSSHLSRMVFNVDYGLTLIIRKIYLEYSQSYRTKEFATGKSHRLGGIRVGFIF